MKEIYRCDLCQREGEKGDNPCYSFEDKTSVCLHGNSDNPEWEPMHTQSELNAAVEAEREALIRDGVTYCMTRTPPDMCNGDTLRAYSKGVNTFRDLIKARGNDK